MTGRRALVIDDDPAVRACFAAVLDDFGIEVLEARHGEEGVLVALMERPDLVFTDLNMPGIGGMGVLEALRSCAPGLPVVVVSGDGSRRCAVEAVRRGASGFLAKPILDFGELERLIRRVMADAAGNKEVDDGTDA